MAIFIFPNTESLAQTAADQIASDLISAIEQRDEAHLVLSGGGTPRPVYERLAKANGVDWRNVHIWFADERNVDPDDDGSNFKMAEEALLAKVDLKPVHIHRIKGEMANENSAADYSIQLKETAPSWGLWPRFDVCILGMGADGHTASLFPGQMVDAEFNQPVIPVTADYDGRPAERTSLTPIALNGSRHIIFLVTGSGKAEPLNAHFEEFDPHARPTQRILPVDGETDWYVDEPAAQFLD